MIYPVPGKGCIQGHKDNPDYFFKTSIDHANLLKKLMQMAEKIIKGTRNPRLTQKSLRNL